MKIVIDMCDWVEIKLTKTGIAHLEKQGIKPPLRHKDGYICWQLWSIMKIFGPAIQTGCELPFEHIKIED